MKRVLYLLIMIVVLSSCGQQTSNKNEKISEVVKSFKKVDKKSVASKPNIVNFSAIGKVNLASMKKDSTNTYKFENCRGSVVQYSNGNISIVVDSLNCDKEAYQYTFFKLKKNKISLVDVQKLGMILFPGKKTYSYLLSEKVYDFTTTPATLMSRADTLDSFTHKISDTPFKKQALQNEEESFKLWNMKLNGKWRLK